MHHMGGLHGDVGIALPLQAGHGLGHIVKLQAVPGPEFFENHGAGKRPADLPAGEGLGNGVFRGGNGLFQSIVIGSAKGNH